MPPATDDRYCSFQHSVCVRHSVVVRVEGISAMGCGQSFCDGRMSEIIRKDLFTQEQVPT